MEILIQGNYDLDHAFACTKAIRCTALKKNDLYAWTILSHQAGPVKQQTSWMREKKYIQYIYICKQKNVTAHIQAMLHCHHWLRMIHTCSATCSDVCPNLAKSRRFLFHSLKIEETSWHRGSSKMLGKCWEGGIFHITTWNINTTNDCINDKSITRQLQLTWWQHQKAFWKKTSGVVASQWRFSVCLTSGQLGHMW